MPYKDKETHNRKNRERYAKQRELEKAQGIVTRSTLWARNNPEKQKARTKRWQSENLDKARAYTQRYRDDNRDVVRQRDREARRIYRETPKGQLDSNVVNCMRMGVKRSSRNWGKYNHGVGYAWFQLRAHIEAQFTDEMSWDNWGPYWELDHIIPLSSFQYESLDDPRFKECWALSNLRPLSRSENAAKGAKLI